MFSAHKAQKSIERNFTIITTQMIPISTEMMISTAMLFYLYGPLFSGIYIVNNVVYYKYTIEKTQLRKKYIYGQHATDKKGDAVISEALQNYFVVKNFLAEDFQGQKYRSVMTSYTESFGGRQRTLDQINLGQKSILTCGLITTLVTATYYVGQGAMSIGDIGFLILLYNMNSSSLFNLGNLYNAFIETTFELKELMRILANTPAVRDSPEAIPYVANPER